MELAILLQHVKNSTAFQRKADLQKLTALLKHGLAERDYPYGDEAAAISTLEGFDLLAASGPDEKLIQEDPWFAGWQSIATNCINITAMGGRPVAAINTLWGMHDEHTRKLLQGITHAAQVYQVPLMGGHADMAASHYQLGVSVLGHAKQLLSSYKAEPGQRLIAAIDLQGQYRGRLFNWQSAATAKSGNARKQLDLLPQLSEEGLLQAGRHIGEGGILASCLMLLEGSHVGAQLQLDKLPKPLHVAWQDWVRSQPSFGFLFSVTEENTETVIQRFTEHGIAAAVVGEINRQHSLQVSHGEQLEPFWDFQQGAFSGISHPEYKLQQPPTQLYGVSHKVFSAGV